LGVVYDEVDKLDTRDPVIVCTISPKQNMSANVHQRHKHMRGDVFEVTVGGWG